MSVAAVDIAAARSRVAIIGIPSLIVGIVIVMVVPLPPSLVDFLLALNLALSVLVLVTAMLVREPLQFSVFPTLLLVMTLFRLALNVSTTRLILSTGFGGRVVEAFGGFVVRGNIIIGLVIFLILIVIQMAVVTSGASRVAEVGARFTLDAMPGKQMAIDADLNGGLITDEQARRRRLEVAREADFYGSMDGASKFVKGDAIAGIVIVTVNLIGGIGVGVLQYGFGIGEAVTRFSLLSVGDGLVSQLPALLISVASGVIVTRASTDDDGGLGGDLWQQLLQNPRVLSIAAGVLALLALLPGLPPVPFLALAGGLGVLALRKRVAAAPEPEPVPEPEPEMNEEMADLVEGLHVEPLELELAPDLFDLVDPAGGGNLLDRVRALRRRLAVELGVIVPLVRTRDDTSLDASSYRLLVNGIEAGRGEAPRGNVLVLADSAAGPLPGRATVEPVFGMPASWVGEELATHLEAQGYTVIDRGSLIVTHLAHIVKSNAAALLTRQAVTELVDLVRPDAPALVEELGPEGLPLSDLQRVLRSLLQEGIPIRDLASILDAVTGVARDRRTPDNLLTAAREALGATICEQAAVDGTLQVLTLEPVLEQSLLDAVQIGAQGPVVAAPPALTSALLDALTDAITDAELTTSPSVLCSAQLRTYIQRLVGRARPNVPVIAYSELVPSVRIETLKVVQVETR